jgi:hypothetical protein
LPSRSRGVATNDDALECLKSNAGYPHAPGFEDFISKEEYLPFSKGAVQAQGFQVNSQAPIKLSIGLSFDQATLQDIRDDVAYNWYPVSIELLFMKFLVSTPVYNSGQFHRIDVAPSYGFAVGWFTGALDTEHCAKDLPELIKAILDRARTRK